MILLQNRRVRQAISITAGLGWFGLGVLPVVLNGDNGTVPLGGIVAYAASSGVLIAWWLFEEA